MLSLRRKLNESIVIQGPDGKNITITITRVRGETISLGFDAPQEYRIWRSEILPRIKDLHAMATTPTPAESN